MGLSLRHVLAGSAVLGAVLSADARADCALISFPPPHYPFDGARVPLGSTLRFVDVFEQHPLGINDPDAIDADDVSLFFQTAGLEPGHYIGGNDAVEVELVDLEDPEQDPAELDLRLDDIEPPSSPGASAIRSTKGGGVSIPFVFDDCGSSPSREVVTVTVRSDERFGLILIDGVARAAVTPDLPTSIELPAPPGETEMAVSVLDLAGNHSEDTVVLVDGGCGCSASTGAPSTMALVSTALMLWRRRRAGGPGGPRRFARGP